MTTRLRDLLALSRRALARADALLVAAPVGLLTVTGCSPTPTTNTVTDVELQSGASTGGGEMVEVHTTSSGSGKPPAKECKSEPAQMTGCGGGRAKLLSSLADCGLEKDKDIDSARCTEFCGAFPTSHCSIDQDGETSYVYCHSAHPCLGRMPARRRLGRRERSAIDVDAYLRHASRMEAVSVDAFVELGECLARFGAPRAFGAACARAAADEARHATRMNGLLERRGARPARARASVRRGFGTLEKLALHNEREGVVGETWGAILAAFQSTRAHDPGVRRAFATIAREEMRHAALSARISAWSSKRLDEAGRARLAAERRRAVERIARTSTGFPGREGANELGWPSEHERRALVAELAAFFA
ncbi:MAG: ferritin-like domain-containing protein [Polyangiaceae bacterium]